MLNKLFKKLFFIFLFIIKNLYYLIIYQKLPKKIILNYNNLFKKFIIKS